MSLTIERLYRYPLTGGPAVEEERLSVLDTQVQGDRAYLLYDENLERIGTKQAPALLRLSFGESILGDPTVTDPENGSSLVLPVNVRGEPRVSVKEFGDEVVCYDSGDEAAEWFSGYLGRDVRLGIRSVEWAMGTVGPDPHERAYAPIHVITQETVEGIREMLGPDAAPISARRFRPNIVVNGASFEEEQQWVGRTLHIGHAIVDVTRGTPRCPVPGLDPDTGENLKDVPKTYRNLAQVDSGGRPKAAVGVYGVPADKPGQRIVVGDEITVE